MKCDAIPRSDPAHRNYQMRGSFFHCYRVHLYRLGLGVQSAYYADLSPNQFFWRPLIAQPVEVLAIVQTVHGAMEERLDSQQREERTTKTSFVLD